MLSLNVRIAGSVFEPRVFLAVLSLMVPDGAAAVGANEAVKPVAKTVEVSTGWDFSLPDKVRPAPNSGVFCMRTRIRNRQVETALGRTFSWAEMNPREGLYEFVALKELLKKARTEDTKAVIRLKGLVAHSVAPGNPNSSMVPDWVLDKHKPPLFDTYRGRSGFITVAAPWNEGLAAEYSRFVARFGSEGFLSNPALAGVYVHGISSSAGEEFWLSRKSNYVEQAESAGMTEDSLNRTFMRRIRLWSEAAGPERGKLAWVHMGQIQGRPWNPKPLNDYALNLGLGWRGGGIEYYHSYSPPDLGQSYSNGYVLVDWSYPLRDGRYFGDEAEIVLGKTHSRDVRVHCMRSTIARAAQLGMNFMWTSNPAVDVEPEMWKWFSLVAGKKAKDSPDAICWLREGYVQSSSRWFPSEAGGTAVWKNFERFLCQRDFEGGYETKPAVRIDRPSMWMDAKDYSYDFAARRTDVEAGDRGMLFFASPEFKKHLVPPFHIKVTWLDKASDEWRISVSTANGCLNSKPVSGGGGEVWRTATVMMECNLESGALPGNADMMLEALGKQDLTVSMVRIVRLGSSRSDNPPFPPERR